MKILFWILVAVSLPAGLFMSIVCYFSNGLDLAFTNIGVVICYLGMLSVVVSIVCAVLGIIQLRKGNVKKAVGLAVAGVVYSGIILAGVFVDDAIHSVRLEKSIAERHEQMYGENWDAAPAIDGIPKLYQEVLNKYYAVVRDRWPADELMGLGALSMADYYGDESLENIGFVLMDLNGDNCNELVIGNAASEEGSGTEIFCIYSDPENPHYSINSVEGQTYYLHHGETEGTYDVEILGRDAAWEIAPAETENTFDFSLWEGVKDPAGRITLEIIPFSQYK